MDFLWHKVSEKEKQEIRNEAKKILDNFSKKLSKIDKKIKEFSIERECGERDEKKGECDEDFSLKIMFKNAPDKEGDFILGEKKKW